jgi:hypothetical protein
MYDFLNKIVHELIFVQGLIACFARRHLRVQLKQLLQPLGVVLKATADVDALQHLVVPLVGPP